MTDSNPNRIGDGSGGPQASTGNPAGSGVQPAVSPTGIALVEQKAVQIAMGLVAVAVSVEGAAAGGVPVPPTILNIAHLVIALGALFGIASPGARKVP